MALTIFHCSSEWNPFCWFILSIKFFLAKSPASGPPWASKMAKIESREPGFQATDEIWHVMLSLRSGKIFDIVKLREKSGNSVLWFTVHKFSSRLWNAFSFGKDEKYAAKQAKRSIWHSMPDTCDSCGQLFSLLILLSQFLFRLSAKSGKRLKMRRKISIAGAKS